ncbi:MAG TPA: hypothetical protein VD887_11520 [Allosphingosinicella sp.]|uniref:hypothetical protein n=1 Tax=Allosphingosinicella sp. TaxID=2823234 RepID=UPI002D6F77B5|nr:hypothetical protein [Allosphingosinicella sp.]
MLKLIVMKRGGQPGHYAINPDLVTYVRSSSGPFTDIHFGEHLVSVEGTFQEVIAKLTGQFDQLAQPPVKNWIKAG